MILSTLSAAEYIAAKHAFKIAIATLEEAERHFAVVALCGFFQTVEASFAELVSATLGDTLNQCFWDTRVATATSLCTGNTSPILKVIPILELLAGRTNFLVSFAIGSSRDWRRRLRDR